MADEEKFSEEWEAGFDAGTIQAQREEVKESFHEGRKYQRRFGASQQEDSVNKDSEDYQEGFESALAGFEDYKDVCYGIGFEAGRSFQQRYPSPTEYQPEFQAGYIEGFDDGYRAGWRAHKVEAESTE